MQILSTNPARTGYRRNAGKAHALIFPLRLSVCQQQYFVFQQYQTWLRLPVLIEMQTLYRQCWQGILRVINAGMSPLCRSPFVSTHDQPGLPRLVQGFSCITEALQSPKYADLHLVFCRKRKLKCNGLRPICTNCARPRPSGRKLLVSPEPTQTECTWDEPKHGVPSQIAGGRRRREDDMSDVEEEGIVPGGRRARLNELEEKIGQPRRPSDMCDTN